MVSVKQYFGMSVVNQSLEITPSHHNWVEVRTLNGPFYVLWAVVLLHHLYFVLLQMAPKN